jgi:hypothetical protein
MSAQRGSCQLNQAMTYCSGDSCNDTRGDPECCVATGELEYLCIVECPVDREVLISVELDILTSTPIHINTAER